MYAWLRSVSEVMLRWTVRKIISEQLLLRWLPSSHAVEIELTRLGGRRFLEMIENADKDMENRRKKRRTSKKWNKLLSRCEQRTSKMFRSTILETKWHVTVEEEPQSEDCFPNGILEKMEEIKLALLENEQSYVQELDILYIQAKEVLSWHHGLPRLNRQCIDKNIQKLKSHAILIEKYVETCQRLDLQNLLDAIEEELTEKFQSYLFAYCENIGELRTLFKQKMRKDSEFFKLLYSTYFQIERTLLPIHRVSKLHSVTKEILELLYPKTNHNKTLLNRTIQLEEKLSEIVMKCHDVTRSVLGSNYMHNIILALFPLDLRLQENFVPIESGEKIHENGGKCEGNLKILLGNEITADDVRLFSRNSITTQECKEDIYLYDTGTKNNFPNKYNDEKETTFGDDYDLPSRLASTLHLSISSDSLSSDTSELLHEIEMSTLKLELKKEDEEPDLEASERDKELSRLQRRRRTMSERDSRGARQATDILQREPDAEFFFGADPTAGSGDGAFPETVSRGLKPSRRGSCPGTCARGGVGTGEEEVELIEMQELSVSAPGTLCRKWTPYGEPIREELLRILETSFDSKVINLDTEESLKTKSKQEEEFDEGVKKVGISTFYNFHPEEIRSGTDGNGNLLWKSRENFLNEEENCKEKRMKKVHKILQRTLWEETDRVVEKNILGTMTKADIALQESKFEILTSELSYLNSLNVLVAVFMNSKELSGILSNKDQEILFKHILKVKKASEMFLYDLAGHWEEDIFLSGIYCEIEKHCRTTLKVYVDYCSNQVNLHRTLQRLLIENTRFAELTSALQSSSECFGNSLNSFLMLPMQRVTRLPLLLQTIEKRLPTDSDEKKECQITLDSLHKLVHECNEAVRKAETESCIEENFGQQKKLSLTSLIVNEEEEEKGKDEKEEEKKKEEKEKEKEKKEKKKR